MTELLKPSEAAEFLRISRRTLDGLEIKFVKISARSVRYDKADLISYIESKKSWPTSICSAANAGARTARRTATNIIPLKSSLAEKPSFKEALAALPKGKHEK